MQIDDEFRDVLKGTYAMYKMIVLDKLNDFNRFKSHCTQGIVGSCEYGDEQVVWKVSKRSNFTCESEFETGRAIMESTLGVLPHFVKVRQCMDVYLSSEDKIARKCLMMENVRGGTFLDVIRNVGERYDVIDLAKQVLVAIAAAQEIISLTHYDLHILNIIVKPTKDEKYVYIFPNGTMHVVATNGLCAVIIDYGYAYTSKARSILPSLYHNQAGFKSYQFSPLSDAMTLLCSIIEEFGNSRSKFVSHVNDMFHEMGNRLNWEHGWFEGFCNVPKEMERILKPPISEVRSDSIFRDCSMIADLVQALIPLPLTEDIEEPFETTYTHIFANMYYNWFLIEEELANPELEAMFLKTVIVSMMHNSTGQSEMIRSVFGRDFEVDYGAIVECIWRMAQMVKIALVKIDKRDTKRRDMYYSKLQVSCALDVFKMLDFTPVTFKRGDRVRFFDLRDGTTLVAHMTMAHAERLNNGTMSTEEFHREVSI